MLNLYAAVWGTDIFSLLALSIHQQCVPYFRSFTNFFHQNFVVSFITDSKRFIKFVSKCLISFKVVINDTVLNFAFYMFAVSKNVIDLVC